MKNKKRGFTLVELLAVIVILAVILVIAVPQVMNIIEDVRKASFSSSVKILASEAEKKYVQNEVLGLKDSISCEGISKLNKEDYEYCSITMDNGIALVTLVGSGKFEWMKVLNGTKTSADVTEDNGEELYTLEDVYRMVNSLTSKYEVLKTEKEELEEKLTNRIVELEDTTSNMSMLKAYPVGSIYMSEDNTNPEELFGGTWEEYGAGRTLVGVDTTQTEFASVGLTGGEKEHTLTIDEMPSHNHGIRLLRQTVYSGSTFPRPSTDGDEYDDISTSAGGSQPHNNLQPYITVYMWKRTA